MDAREPEDLSRLFVERAMVALYEPMPWSRSLTAREHPEIRRAYAELLRDRPVFAQGEQRPALRAG